MSMRRDGLFAAIWTPVGPDGSLLADDLGTIIKFLRQHGTHGILALGSTGEFLHFTTSQRKRILERILQFADGMPVVANVSHVNPRAATDLALHARSAGAQAIALLPPWFYPVRQEDLAEFFISIAEAARLPLLLYNFPELTGKRIEIETIINVADRVPLAGIKHSGGQFEYHKELIAVGKQKGFPIFTGSDTRFPEALSLGARGCFGGLVNVTPDLLSDIFRANETGQPELARESARRMVQLGSILDKAPFPLNVGAVMSARGLPIGYPKQIVSSRTQAACEVLMAEAKALFAEWQLN